MRRNVNLAFEIKSQLPAELVSFVEQAGRLARERKERLYLVGGTVRDLMLKRPNLDLDLVVEGNAIPLARALAGINRAKLTTYSAFNTAKLRWDSWTADIATARSEFYRRPGALPSIQPGSLESDLLRRDFTVNAMAIDLSPENYGALIDIVGGRIDIINREIRILHDRSFIDDATRIWRAIRYEQRLGFRIEKVTRRLLRENLPMLETISGDRIRHEIDLVLKEEHPERVLRRAFRLGALQRLSPSLQGDGWLGLKFAQARRLTRPQGPTLELAYALLCYRLTEAEAESLMIYLSPPRSVIESVTGAIRLKQKLADLALPNLPTSRIYDVLELFPETAVMANMLATGEGTVRNRLRLYLDKWRHVKPQISGEDLVRLGIGPGPRIKMLLRRLLEARLNGKVRTRDGELRLVKRWMKESPDQSA